MYLVPKLIIVHNWVHCQSYTLLWVYNSYLKSDFFVIDEKMWKYFLCNPSLPQQDLIFCYWGNNLVWGKTGACNMLGNTDGKQPASSQGVLYNLITCPHLFLPWVIYLVVISPVCSCTVRLRMKSWLISPLGRVLYVRLTSYYRIKGHFAGKCCQQYVSYCFSIHSNYADKVYAHVCMNVCLLMCNL